MKIVFRTLMLIVSIPLVLPFCVLYHAVLGIFRGLYTYCYDFNNTDIGEWVVTYPKDRVKETGYDEE